MGAKENQHYIPQGYLRGFAIAKEKSLVWEYDKESGQISLTPRSIRAICSKHLYYAQDDGEGQLDKQTLEDAFQAIEDKVPRIIRRINVSRIGERVALSGEEHGTPSFFVALLLTRVPSFRDGIEDIHRRYVETYLVPAVEHSYREGTMPPIIEELYKKGQLLTSYFKMRFTHHKMMAMRQKAWSWPTQRSSRTTSRRSLATHPQQRSTGHRGRS